MKPAGRRSLAQDCTGQRQRSRLPHPPQAKSSSLHMKRSRAPNISAQEHSAQRMSRASPRAVQLHSRSCTRRHQTKDLSVPYRNWVLLKMRMPATTTTEVMPASISRFCQMTGSETPPVWNMTDSESVT